MTTYPELVTIKQAAEICNVSKQTIRRYIRMGRIAVTRYTHQAVLIKSEDLKQFIHEHTQE